MKEFPCLFILLLLSLSCKKPKQPTPAKQCNNSFIAFKYDVGGDSLRLISVDAATGESVNSLYDFAVSRQGTGVYIPQEKLYYIFQQDKVGKIFLFRYHLDNNQTDILDYSGSLSGTSNPVGGQILYSAKYARLFYIRTHTVSSSPESKIFELIINGATCTEKDVTPNGSISNIIVWSIINEATGELCYSTYGGGYRVYDAGTGKTAKYTPNNSIISETFNANDSMFYGIDTYPARFCKMNPQTGDVLEIKSLPFDVDGYYTHGTLDACKNQYILQVGGDNSSPANIYWIDVKTGNIVKEIHSNDQYTELTSTEKYN